MGGEALAGKLRIFGIVALETMMKASNGVYIMSCEAAIVLPIGELRT